MSKIKTKIAYFCSGFGRRRGSILLEIAIALSVIGLISGFFITKTIAANRAMRAQITKNNIETVTVALASFLAHCNRLPRPSPNKGGYEGTETEDLTGFSGTVPFRTLGIPLKFATDGNGRPLVYAVEPGLTLNFRSIYEKSTSACFCNEIQSRIIVAGVLPPAGNPIAFVIDTADNSPRVSDRIFFRTSPNIVWIFRDMLLMKYLKSAPCRREEPWIR
ncbi:MAG: hypothetical protein LBO73_03185 [Holosporaceae bacterium]|jgi:hypothetical protein|nr:hypothetical protein [Holosporaceae bacterium]